MADLKNLADTCEVICGMQSLGWHEARVHSAHANWLTGLLNNYVEIDKISGNVRADVLSSTELTGQRLRRIVAIISTTTVVSAALVIYSPFVALTVSMGGLLAALPMLHSMASPISELNEKVETSTAECLDIKKSNHIFPDIFPAE